MGTRYASLGRCIDVPEREVIAALVSRDECAALLERIASTTPPRSAIRALSTVLARLATPACAWLEGELAVELFEEDDGTKVRVMSEIGAGLRERVLPPITLEAAVEDVLGEIGRRHDVAPLFRVERVSTRCALLLAYEEEEGPPASTEFDISETSLAWAVPGASPDDVDSGWDDAPAR